MTQETKRFNNAQELIANDQKAFFHQNGYLILKNFFSASEVRAFKNHLDELWKNRSESPFIIDCYLEDNRPDSRRHFADTETEVRASPYKINDTHLESELVQEFAIGIRLSEIIENLLSAKPTVCNSLLFERGSQQPAHFDTFYMPSKTPNKMCATWIAFDSVSATNGPLFYYPKSHLVTPYLFKDGTTKATNDEFGAVVEYIEESIKKHNLEKVYFYPSAGDVLIWHAQLLHGGAAIENMNETRTSLVTHYWTTLDYPDKSHHRDIGDDRLILVKEHQVATSTRQRKEIEKFIGELTTSEERLTSVPEGFNAYTYLVKNPDVLSHRADPYEHYMLHGKTEGRVW